MTDEERIDHRELALIEKAAAATVGVYPESDHIEVVMDLRELGQVAKRLLTEHSAREERDWLHRCDGALSTALEGGIKDMSTRCATSQFADELRAFLVLPATESAQPEEET